MIIDDVIDAYVDKHGEELSLYLLKAIALPEHGGLGYQMRFFDPWLDIDGYEVDHQRKLIALDTSGIFSYNDAEHVANALKNALQVEIIKSHPSCGL